MTAAKIILETDLRSRLLTRVVRVPPETLGPPGHRGHPGRGQPGRTLGARYRYRACFDEIDHDALMVQVARQVSDRDCVLKLLRKLARAGVFEGGVVTDTVSGTPQGSPCDTPDAIANFEFEVSLPYVKGEETAVARSTTPSDIYNSM